MEKESFLNHNIVKPLRRTPKPHAMYLQGCSFNTNGFVFLFALF